ncbi:MAG: NosD domain-containing protein [Candidatus Odinarchaeota archaeon]
MTKSTLKKSIALVLIIIFLPIIRSSGIINSFSANCIKNDKIKIYLSPAIHIFINGTARGVGAQNWTWASSQEWCQGSGTKNDPYLIENVYAVIDIVNSNCFFVIRYCLFGDLLILNTSNAVLFNNTLNNPNNEIKIIDSRNFNISDNYISRSTTHGISLNLCNNFTISNNKLIEIDNYAIYCTNCLNLNIENNYLTTMNTYYYHLLKSIYLSNVNFSKLNGNILQFLKVDYHIFLYQSNYNLIHNNSILSSHGFSSLYLQESSFNNITNNSFQEESQGIFLWEGCCNNRILYNNISHIYDGIRISEESNNNQIILNQVEYIRSDGITDGNGITISDSSFNVVLNNTLKYSKYGIELTLSNYNVIKYNEILEYTLGCIEETSCEGNVIADNYCSSSIAPSDNDNRINWYFFIFIFIGLGLLAIILITKIRKR